MSKKLHIPILFLLLLAFTANTLGMYLLKSPASTAFVQAGEDSQEEAKKEKEEKDPTDEQISPMEHAISLPNLLNTHYTKAPTAYSAHCLETETPPPNTAV